MTCPGGMNRRRFLRSAGFAAGAVLAGRRVHAETAPSPPPKSDDRPSILFAIGDDWGWPFAGALGDRVIRTPTFDRVAREGVLFTHAYCASPSCTPSRGSILTGQMFWRLQEGANLWSVLPRKFQVYPDLLEAAGYHVGLMKKGWGPGDFKSGGWTRNPAGPTYKSFDEFLQSVPAGKPFCFWFGSNDPHRPYEAGSGVASGLKADEVKVPPHVPDVPEVRADILDYYAEVERYDRDVGQMLAALEKTGRLDNTIVVMTGDNGWPFPRGKTNLYDYGSRQPLAVRWAARAIGGRVIDDFISFTDFAPTFLEAAGLEVPGEMTGRSFLDLLVGNRAGRVDQRRDRVFIGRERHHGGARPGQLGYPMRAVRTHEYLYVRNFLPDRWPAGDPEGFADCDPGPTKNYMLRNRDDPKVAPLFELAFGKRPAEELYDLRADLHQTKNVAADPAYAETRRRLADDLARYLKETADPRITGQGEVFDKYPYVGTLRT